jgi:FAD/FMN-containing dehydrogenase
MARYDIDGLIKRLTASGIRTENNPTLVQMKSRDFYWYSPVLKRQLEAVTGDLIVSPTTQEQVIETLAACHARGIPVTPRGTGTGNYGQAMPLSGGVVLDLSGMNAIHRLGNGRVATGPGIVLADIDTHTRRENRMELRLHPSTYKTASLGGFVAGGSGGVGSIKWGGLRDYGNLISLKVVTMEATPRVLELSGTDLHKVSHAYGTNGIITEVEVPLAPAYDWVDVIVGFDTLREAIAYANSLGEQDGLALKQLAVIAAPVGHDYFNRHKAFIPRDQHIVTVMAADFAVDAMLAFTGTFKRATVLMRGDKLSPEQKKGLPPVYELGWNHTTLRALRVDPSITYLQALYPFPNVVDVADKIHARLGDECPAHLEFVRFDGKVTAFGLPLVRFTSEQRLDDIVKIHEDMGAPVFNPHRYTLEEGGMKQTDDVQLAFKREADPQGLLNPGKMIAWEDPSYDYKSGKTFLFRGLGQG